MATLYTVKKKDGFPFLSLKYFQLCKPGKLRGKYRDNNLSQISKQRYL